MKKLSLKQVRNITILLLLIVYTGCESEGFLSPEPETIETGANFFETEDQFLQSVNGAYSRLQEWVLQAHVLLEARSDNTTNDNELNRGVLASISRIDWFGMRADESEVEQAWNTLFTGIKDANLPLSELDRARQNGILEEELAQRLEGELKFLRGFFYFTAVRLWGDVPLILEPFSSGLETFEIVRNPKEEVFEAILQDLRDAETLLPESFDSSNKGRATSFAAKAMLAKVYLWQSNFANAEEKLREIVNSNRFSLLQDYSRIFDPDNKFNDEIIHEVPFKQGSEGESSNFIFQFAPVGSFPEVIPRLVSDGTWGKNLPTLQLVNAYEDGDLRREASIGIFDPQGENIPYVKKWDEATNEDFARTNHNWPLIRYADVLLMLAEAINEQGGNMSEAETFLNQVRNRAALNDTTTMGQSELRDIILQERRFELAFENHRWFDLVRKGVAVEVMRAHGEEFTDNPPTPFNQVNPLPDDAFNVQEFMTLYPIPENEIILNDNMTQNPGY